MEQADAIVNRLTVYKDEMSWRRFVPPLPKHKGFGDGWCLIADALLNIPICMLVEIIRINFRVSVQ